mmetsp:Transcript_42704/g.91594  ORF Transcript_42704/g.91594 Transcript_42704/m.91594 type:complete len:437 (-) Transcript_42704:134-1444(-)|eukprot:CAMPEP_0206463564 /NCGR_PEP_ID=MMETSP0324_2-20121206/26681_1 /ASSEMBLY_ACC=CAM_ASM_000836 /TAXON_ID=2866 /ORGANISM="Crypthecodinium cohnii, Strain Seligo" /LENGTH=436 /DNA_ID=CAMNT_0053935999 /DNA_START=48 /DNA_END=1358 /DNA_ORIENTATION=-
MGDVTNWLTKGKELQEKALELETAGQYQQAVQTFRQSIQVWEFVLRHENNPHLKPQWEQRLTQLKEHTDQLEENVKNGPPRAAPVNGVGMMARPPDAAPAADDAESQENKEKDALRKGLEGAIMTSKPNVKWEDIAGLHAAKEALQETVILPALHPELFVGALEPWHGILLYGPPGTGKSCLAKACATEADATFFSISSSDLVSKWMGESEKLVRNLFEMARENKPSIIFIDEVDSLAGARGESSESDAARRIKTEFLAQMDGVGKSKEGLLVLAATNTPWDMDSAIRRRFERRIYIPLPDLEARIAMLKIHLKDGPTALTPQDMQQLAERTEGFSGADLHILVRQAAMVPLRRDMRAMFFKRVTHTDGTLKWQSCSPGDPQAVEMSWKNIPKGEFLPHLMSIRDFEVALDAVRPSVGPGDLKQHEEYTAQYGMEG